MPGGLSIDNTIDNEIDWHEKLSELLDQAYATLKLGEIRRKGQWRPFTVVVIGYQKVNKKPEHKEDGHDW
jgi:hypothetical protein